MIFGTIEPPSFLPRSRRKNRGELHTSAVIGHPSLVIWVSLDKELDRDDGSTHSEIGKGRT
jgi:hypothetical protein